MSRKNRRRYPSEQVSGPPVASGVRQVGALRLDPGTSTLFIEPRKLDAPAQAYDADVAWIEHRRGRLSIFFGKYSPVDQEALQSCLQIRYSPEDFVRTFWKNSAEFSDRVKKYVEGWPADARPVFPLPKSKAVEKFHSDWASYTYMSHSGSEASFDFYHLSTAGIARLAQLKELEGVKMRGVVRVQLATFDMHRLLSDDVAPLVQEIMDYLPEQHRIKDAQSPEEESDADADALKQGNG